MRRCIMPKMKLVDLSAMLDASGGLIDERDFSSVGPSDSSDTRADMIGVGDVDSTSDRNGTGERGTIENDAEDDFQSDIGADGIVSAEDAGLGGGLGQAGEGRV